jgi:hypothetical protein
LLLRKIACLKDVAVAGIVVAAQEEGSEGQREGEGQDGGQDFVPYLLSLVPCPYIGQQQEAE